MTLKAKVKTLVRPEEVRSSVCVDCINKFSEHKQVVHFMCFLLLREEGFGDVRPPPVNREDSVTG